MEYCTGIWAIKEPGVPILCKHGTTAEQAQLKSQRPGTSHSNATILVKTKEAPTSLPRKGKRYKTGAQKALNPR